MHPSLGRILVILVILSCNYMAVTACFGNDPEIEYYRKMEIENTVADLIKAVDHNDYAAIAKLKKYVNYISERERSTAMVRAICKDGEDLKMIQFLLDHGADPNKVDGGRAPIGWAAACDKLGITKLLLEHGAKTGDALKGSLGSLAHLGRSSPTFQVLRYLLDFEIKNIHKKTDIIVAGLRDRPKVVIFGTRPGEDAIDFKKRCEADSNIKSDRIVFTHSWLRYPQKEKMIERIKTVLLVHNKNPQFGMLPKEILHHILSFLPDMFWVKAVPKGVVIDTVVATEVTRRLHQVKKFLTSISYILDPKDKRHIFQHSYSENLFKVEHVMGNWEECITEQVRVDLVTPWAQVKTQHHKKQKVEA